MRFGTRNSFQFITDLKLRHIQLFSILIALFLLHSGCERDEFSWGTRIGSITYAGNVIFLGAEELSLLKEVTVDRIVFSDNAGRIDKISGKSIMVLGVSEMTPYGLLRRVTGITTAGNDVIITTTDAELADAIKEGTIRLEKKLVEEDFRLKSKAGGVLLEGPNKSFDGLAVTLDSMVISDDGTNIARIDGAIGISPEIGLTINLAFNELNEAGFETTLNKIDEITISSTGPFNGGNEIIAAEFIHTPIIIDSLVFVAEVAISCGYEGHVLSGVTSGVRQDRIITSRMNYQDLRWAEDPVSHSENHDFIKPLITDDSDLKIFSGPEITLKLFGIPLQVIKATGYYTLEAEKTGSPGWKLSIGSDGQNKVVADILGLRGDHILDLGIEASEIGNSTAR